MDASKPPPPQPPPPQQPQQAYGGPYQQAMPAQVLPYSKSWHVTKIVFQSISLLFSIIALGLGIALTVSPGTFTLHYLQILWVAPTTSVAILWAVAELITICARREGRGIHPGAHVGVHLLLWLGFCIADALTAYMVAIWVVCDDYYCRSYGHPYGYRDSYRGTMQAQLAFLSLLVPIHFFLFVRACVETARRNSNRSRQVIVVPSHMYYAQQPPMAPAAYYPPPPQQQQQAHMSGYHGGPPPPQSPSPVSPVAGGHDANAYSHVESGNR